ncbi:MAG: sulfatase-like hydrolase/transferase [Pseudomonadales bacterium]|nr:sulfatase-like hydrolase/transferase [Pseudomonadales bacterium]
MSLHIGLLASLAIAQPLYSVLSQGAEFFIAHNSSVTSIMALIGGLSVLLPLTFIIIVLTARKYSLALMVIMLLAALAIMPPIKSTLDISWQLSIGLALLFGAAIAFAHRKFPGFRMWLSFFSPAILLFPLLFVLNSPVGDLLFSNSDNNQYNTQAIEAENLPPIFLVIFDEFATTSLMDEQQKIDSARYPNFASFAEQATWYKNATTVQLATTQAVPAILSGQLPYQNEKTRLPTAQEYPETLFSWLADSYPLNVSEKITSLCPKQACNSENTRHTPSSTSLIKDIFYIYLHIVVPGELSIELPDISSNWAEFGNSTPTNISDNLIDTGEAARFRKFVNNIDSNNANGLHVIHSILPHVPYRYLPNGQIYTYENGVPKGVENEIWTNNSNIVDSAYHRYLLQVAYVDTLLGKLLTRLKALDVYDSALIILTADHGVSFKPGTPRRDLADATYQDVLPVPLLMKLPHQTTSHTDIHYVSNLDILPTVADILGITVPWDVDGYSLLSGKSRDKILVPFPEPANDIEFDAKATLLFPSLKKQLKLFGSNSSFSADIRSDINSKLIGTIATNSTTPNKYYINFHNPLQYQYVDLNSGFIPAKLSGEVLSKGDGPSILPTKSLRLAISFNGVIRAITSTSNFDDKPHYFSTMIHSSAFRQGSNLIEAFVIGSSKTDEYTFSLIPDLHQTNKRYALVRNDAGIETILDSTGTKILLSGATQGHLEGISIRENRVFFSGWAVTGEPTLNGNSNTIPLTPATVLHLFIGGDLVYSGQPDIKRLDVANYFHNPALELCGYNIELPSAFIRSKIADATQAPDIQVIAGNASGSMGKLKISASAVSRMLENFAFDKADAP